MKVAVAGKGGAGKTTIAGAIARVVAARGDLVIAIDGDGNPNLSTSLGVPAADVNSGRPVPHAIVESRSVDGKAHETLAAPLEEILGQFTSKAPDGISLMTMARPEAAGSGCLCTSHGTVRGFLGLVPDEYGWVVLDLEASPEHLTRGTPKHADWLLLVTEPTYKSLETTRRYHDLAVELGVPGVGVVANKVTSDDVELMTDFCADNGFELLATVPFDSDLRQAEILAVSPYEHAGGGPAIGAIERLVDSISEARVALAN